MSNPIQCTANLYGCESPEDIAASLTLHPDTDGNGVYLRIRLADGSPLAGLDLTMDQAERLKTALGWAIVKAHACQINREIQAREISP